MDYPFENLDPERFQLLCQSLLVREFPNVQCLPVAQPDGGRDAVHFTPESSKHDFVVFQVKFLRKPQEGVTPSEWLQATLKDELPKINELVNRGAKQYVVMTNVHGTAHLDRGSIDRVNEVLAALPVPAVCWWRDDISRRLDNAWDLKWIYPELMTGPDLIRAVVESGLSEDRERRGDAIRAFVTDQFSREAEVRFKQVELQNRLLELFIDVPLLSPDRGSSQRHIHDIHNAYATIYYELERKDPAFLSFAQESDERWSLGAATFLLHRVAQQNVPFAVIEGAPGQGKSTITQYVCQVHRMRLLRRIAEIDQIPEYHRNQPVRIPLRVDLRDYAVWLGKRNPFAAAEASSEAPPHWNKSLESFLAMLIQEHSGGVSFSTADLHAIGRTSALLLVLDGLDEVAEITRRQEVVDEITRGVIRLKEVAASLQVVVTSRPAAFAKSPGLPEAAFPYFQLGSVTRPQINQYAEKWLRARGLHGHEAKEVRVILDEKLHQPHLRDLARNPMQLAILLSLIHTRGASLPDKRTALYDSYVELFFSREAEKSVVVRDHRDLLIDIHRYLGFLLHAESEAGNESGAITTDRLEKTVHQYLESEGHAVELAPALFRGMVERVVALVSRVEGTFEFEVQPLREYFAARYLYDTAPYSPPGNERSGTKPDRFDALARDFYWFNATRFYAGCFSKGELPALVDRLQELLKESSYQRTSHPRFLAWTLLTDWVFSQHPRSVEAVMDLLLRDSGIRYLLISNYHVRGQHPWSIPRQAGQDDLLRRSFTSFPSVPRDVASGLADVMRSNPGSLVTELWQSHLAQAEPDKGLLWLECARSVGILNDLPIDELRKLRGRFPIERFAEALLRSHRSDFLDQDAELTAAAVTAILACRYSGRPRLLGRSPASVVELFAAVVAPEAYAVAMFADEPTSLQKFWQRQYAGQWITTDKHPPAQSDLLKRCREVVDWVIEEAQRPVQQWGTSISPWEGLIETIRSRFGHSWLTASLANVAAGIRSHTETCNEASVLSDDSVSLARRARYARLRAGTASWWRRQLEFLDDEDGIAVALLFLLTWASGSTLVQLADLINAKTMQLSRDKRRQLLSTLESTLTHPWDIGERAVVIAAGELPSELSPSVVVLMGARAKPGSRRELVDRYLSTYDGHDQQVWEFCQRVAIEILLSDDKGQWQTETLLVLIRRAYSEGAWIFPYTSLFRTSKHRLESGTAIEISDNPDSYPLGLLAIAEPKTRMLAAEQTRPIMEIAKANRWL